MPTKVPACGNLNYHCPVTDDWPQCKAGHKVKAEVRSGKKTILCGLGDPGCKDYHQGEILTLEELKEKLRREG
jgi:hypothetical protein